MWRIAATAPRSKHSIFQKRPSSSLTPIVGRSIGTSPVAKPTKRFGVEHVGVGSDIDLDGYDALPEDYKKWLRGLYKSSYAFRDKMDTDGVNHYKRMYDITDGLIRRGYFDADIELILGGNFRRVLGQIWNTKV